MSARGDDYDPGRRALLTWGIVLLLVVVAFAAAVASLNRELYSSSGFVRGYVEAVASHDVRSALEYPGVTEPQGVDETLLTADALADISDIHVLSDVSFDADSRLVTVGMTLTGNGGAEHAVESTFQVRSAGTRFGLFENWRFVTSPVGTLTITSLNDPSFRVNGQEVDPAETVLAGDASSYLVLTPGLYRLDHESKYLTATAVDAVISQPASATAVTVEAKAKPAFVKRVQKEIDAYLDDCTSQKVLFPTDCPFGQFFANRITTDPVWSMATYPPVTISGTGTGWMVPRTGGNAHLVVDVRSLFDGSVSTFDEDVPFTVSYSVSFTPEGDLTITEID